MTDTAPAAPASAPAPQAPPAAPPPEPKKRVLWTVVAACVAALGVLVVLFA